MATPFEIHIAPGVALTLQRAPRPIRTAVQRQLREVARVAGLRNWDLHDEKVDSVPLQSPHYEAACSLDVIARRVTLCKLVPGGEP